MPVSIIDSGIYGNLFGSDAMRAVFSERGQVQKWLDVEAALARVQGRLGIIPEDAAAQISGKADADLIDMDLMREEVDRVGYAIMPLVHRLAALCEGDAGRYVHWGTTTQDIKDTGVVLQIRDALDLVEADLIAVRDGLARLARKYRDTPMAGRSHLQHALPITFGYKAAVWLAPIERHLERLEQLRPRVLMGQFSGAAGTLASLHGRGLEVSDALMEELGLARPAIAWHTARDTIAETLAFLALVTGSLAKIATDVVLLTATETGEVFEPFAPGRGGSSTMPQKRNPVSSELILACAKQVQSRAALVMDAMAADLERSTGPWHVEWAALPEAFVLASGALAQARFLMDGLRVDPEAMRANMDMTRGLIVSEAVMMGLAPALGRQAAHDLVYEACRIATDERRALLDVLLDMPEVTAKLDRDALAQLCEPGNYVGEAPEMVDRLLAG
ncbi:MAG: 3-carboxy-cis,cis-muconate cycloisomerase, partial [Alphaproteobacteria bacterium]|nr:3-carboxy-cis,cis-muconate cycloisomerase [Alphaproteobacteria bacterium]